MEEPLLVFKKDRFPDMVCHFETARVAWPAPGTNCGAVRLTGTLNDGTPIFGIDNACLAGETNCATRTPTSVDNPPLSLADIPPSTDYLTFSQNPLPFRIDRPGFTAGPVAVTVSSSKGPIGSLSIPFVHTSNGMNWLTATVSGGNTLGVSIVDTGALAMAGTYSGTVTVRVNDDPSTDSVLTVTLQAGSCGGLVANPPSWSHIGFAQQTFYVTNNDGFIVPVIGGLYPSVFFSGDPRVVNNPDGTVTVRLSSPDLAGIDQPPGFSGYLVLLNSFCHPLGFGGVQVPINVTIK
jgi:hypothetical protein